MRMLEQLVDLRVGKEPWKIPTKRIIRPETSDDNEKFDAEKRREIDEDIDVAKRRKIKHKKLPEKEEIMLGKMSADERDRYKKLKALSETDTSEYVKTKSMKKKIRLGKSFDDIQIIKSKKMPLLSIKPHQKERDVYEKQKERAKLDLMSEEEKKEYLANRDTDEKISESKKLEKIDKLDNLEENEKQKQQEVEKVSLMDAKEKKQYLKKKKDDKKRQTKKDKREAEQSQNEQVTPSMSDESEQFSEIKDDKINKNKDDKKRSLIKEGQERIKEGTIMEEKKKNIDKLSKKGKDKYEKKKQMASPSSEEETTEHVDEENIEKGKPGKTATKLAKMDKQQRAEYKKKLKDEGEKDIEEDRKSEATKDKDRKRGGDDVEAEEKASEPRIPKLDEEEETKSAVDKLESTSKEKFKDKQRITVTEKGGVLVVEKRVPKTDSLTRGGKVMVSLSQFNLLEAKVSELMHRAPLPPPGLPVDQDLLKDLASGRASLTETMEALRVSDRVQAAEQKIGHLADLLTEMAAAGALPQEVVEQVDEVKAEIGVVADKDDKSTPTTPVSADVTPVPTTITTLRPKGTPRKSVTSAAAEDEMKSKEDCVTHEEFNNFLRQVRDDMINHAFEITIKPDKTASTAYTLLLSKGDIKDDNDVNMMERLDKLKALVENSILQIKITVVDLQDQVRNFSGTMTYAREWLHSSIGLITGAPADVEAEECASLYKAYEKAMAQLNGALYNHRELCTIQGVLNNDFIALMNNLEMMHNEKADTDEVKEILQTKADIHLLDGMFTLDTLHLWIADVEDKLDNIFKTFKDQENSWMNEMKHIKDTLKRKTSTRELISEQCDKAKELRLIQAELKRQQLLVGDPEVTRTMLSASQDSYCGACKHPAHQSLRDPCQGQPHELPPLGRREPPEGPSRPDRKLKLPKISVEINDSDSYQICHRWTGGSHTLISPRLLQHRISLRPVQRAGPPVVKYFGIGRDGKVYNFEEKVEPCVQCDRTREAAEIKIDGAGDSGFKKWTLGMG